MSFLSSLYQSVFRSSATFAAATVASAFFFERVVDKSTNVIFYRINKGRLFEDVQTKYKALKAEADEE